jgi:hypothetical protein
VDEEYIKFSDFYLYSDRRKLNYNTLVVYTDKYVVMEYIKGICRGRLKKISAQEIKDLTDLAKRFGIKRVEIDIKKIQEVDFNKLLVGDKTLNLSKSEGTWAYEELMGTRVKKTSRAVLASQAMGLLRYLNKKEDKVYKGTMLYITDSNEIFTTLVKKLDRGKNRRTILIDGRFVSDDFIFNEIDRRVRLFSFTKGQRKKISEALQARIDLLKDFCDDLGVVPLDVLGKTEVDSRYDRQRYTISNVELEPIIDEVYIGNYYNFIDRLILKPHVKEGFKPNSQDFKTFSRFKKAHGDDKMASDILYRVDLFIEIKLLLIQGHISYEVRTQNYSILKSVGDMSRLARINQRRRIYYIDACGGVSLEYLINLKSGIKMQRDTLRYGKGYVGKLEKIFLSSTLGRYQDKNKE